MEKASIQNTIYNAQVNNNDGITYFVLYTCYVALSIGSGQILVTARFTSPFAVFIDTTRTILSFPGCTATTFPIFHLRGGRLSSFNTTTVPGAMLAPEVAVHFALR